MEAALPRVTAQIRFTTIKLWITAVALQRSSRGRQEGRSGSVAVVRVTAGVVLAAMSRVQLDGKIMNSNGRTLVGRSTAFRETEGARVPKARKI